MQAANDRRVFGSFLVSRRKPRKCLNVNVGQVFSSEQWLQSASAVAAAATNTDQHSAAQLGSRLGQALRVLNQPAGMSGVRIKLRYQEREQESPTARKSNQSDGSFTAFGCFRLRDVLLSRRPLRRRRSDARADPFAEHRQASS
jgi:hypothetical protein